MQSLHDTSPDRRAGPASAAPATAWRRGVPVAWAPGQGIVKYPGGMGVPLKTTDKVVIQIHYNLADPASAGKSDSTTVHLQFTDSVNRQLAFLLPDPFSNRSPTRPPTRCRPARPIPPIPGRHRTQMGLDGIPSVDSDGRDAAHARARAPADDAHRTGGGLPAPRTSRAGTSTGRSSTSTRRPPDHPDSQVQVTCEYDTSADTAPVLPGWGTRNEMCLNILMLALPATQ